MNRPWLREAQTAVRQVEALGSRRATSATSCSPTSTSITREGWTTSPSASIHLLDAEEKSAWRQRTLLDRMRYRPLQWASRPALGDVSALRRRALVRLRLRRQLAGVAPGILLVPLAGHTLGHAGVAVEADGGWLLHAGDAYFYREEMRPRNPACTPGCASTSG
jgi:hypothetical protein